MNIYTKLDVRTKLAWLSVTWHSKYGNSPPKRFKRILSVAEDSDKFCEGIPILQHQGLEN